MRRIPRGFTLTEILIVIGIMGIALAGVLSRIDSRKLEANIEITKRNAEQILHGGKAWWSATRTIPSSVSDLATNGYLGINSVPNNPLGGAFTVTGQTVGSGSVVIIVRTTISKGGGDAYWADRLDANGVVAGGGIEWRRFVTELSSAGRASSEAFRNMYY